jgi:hypothetical protein
MIRAIIYSSASTTLAAQNKLYSTVTGGDSLSRRPRHVHLLVPDGLQRMHLSFAGGADAAAFD